MPEIAEVRTVRKTLNERIVGRKIIGLDIIYDKIIENELSEFVKIIDSKFKSVTNYGKWLMFNLDNNYTILSHLRMEGKYFIKDKNDEIERHEHIIIHLDNEMDLRYHDTRKFGKMILVKTEDVYNSKEISKLGIEPDSDDLTKEYLYGAINKKKTPIKTLLLDQTIINGLGNIYVDEVLFDSFVNPTRLGNTITLDECEKIVFSCKKIIPKATKLGGTTIRSYTSSLGVTGHYQDELKVHTLVGKECINCKTKIEKTRVGGRGTYFCPNCQK